MKLLNSDVTDDIGGVSVGSVLLHLVFASIHGPELLAGESGHHGSPVGVTQHVGGGAAAVTEENIYSGLEEKERDNLHKPVHGPEEGDVLDGGVDGGEDDDHEDQGGAGQGGAGHTGGGGGQPGERELEGRQ